MQRGKINRVYYEIALLKLLKRDLRCKNIWVQGAFKYADPEKDLPHDFKKHKSLHCQMLIISEDPHQEISKLKRNMLNSLSLFNASIVNDTEVRIGIKAKKSHIYLTPYEAQDVPANIDALKDERLSLA